MSSYLGICLKLSGTQGPTGFVNRMAWSIVSTDIERSRKVPVGTSFLSIPDIILSVNSRVACSVEWLGRTPYWLSENSVLLSKYNDSCV